MRKKRTLKDIEKAIEKSKDVEKAIPAGFYIVLKGHYERKIFSLCPKCFKKYLLSAPPFDVDDFEGHAWKPKKLKGEVECNKCRKKMRPVIVKIQKKKPMRRIQLHKDWIK